jgi:hypothetical protein
MAVDIGPLRNEKRWVNHCNYGNFPPFIVLWEISISAASSAISVSVAKSESLSDNHLLIKFLLRCSYVLR